MCTGSFHPEKWSVDPRPGPKKRTVRGSRMRLPRAVNLHSWPPNFHRKKKNRVPCDFFLIVAGFGPQVASWTAEPSVRPSATRRYDVSPLGIEIHCRAYRLAADSYRPVVRISS